MFDLGQYGLMADNLLSAHLVLGNGTAITVSDKEHVDLFWALKGAGHNFGIVTSFKYKIYDRTKENENFAIETLIFTGDKLEEVFEQANKLLVNRPVELTWFSMFMPMPNVDTEKVCRNTVIILLLANKMLTHPARHHLHAHMARHHNTLPIHSSLHKPQPNRPHKHPHRPPRLGLTNRILERKPILPTRQQLPRTARRDNRKPHPRAQESVRNPGFPSAEFECFVDYCRRLLDGSCACG